jgi:hypothetical protein
MIKRHRRQDNTKRQAFSTHFVSKTLLRKPKSDKFYSTFDNFCPTFDKSCPAFDKNWATFVFFSASRHGQEEAAGSSYIALTELSRRIILHSILVSLLKCFYQNFKQLQPEIIR